MEKDGGFHRSVRRTPFTVRAIVSYEKVICNILYITLLTKYFRKLVWPHFGPKPGTWKALRLVAASCGLWEAIQGEYECIVLILLILATFLRVTAFRGGHSPTPTFFQNRLKFRGGAYIFGRSVTHAMKASESEYDNYDDFLNLDKPIGGDSKKVELTKQEVSILPPKICSESGEIVVDADGKNMLPPPRKFEDSRKKLV